MGWFKRLFGISDKPQTGAQPVHRLSGLFSTDVELDRPRRGQGQGVDFEKLFPKPLRLAMTNADGSIATTDANDVEDSVKFSFGQSYGNVPEGQLLWYASQSFIGYQMCALLAQHWLIDKACTMPAKDAVRKGWDLTVNNGVDVEAKVLDYVRECDEVFKITYNLQEYIRFGRVFGIRVALFVIDFGSDEANDDWYSKPFNIDGVQKDTYKGISQIDPYWVTPQLTRESTLRPGGIHFYEPEFWTVNGKQIHRSHLCIYTTGTVSDVLKPAYLYGGVSIPQKVFERVYAAERTANEAPQLAMTKRLMVMGTDLEKAILDQSLFDERMNWFTSAINNYGVKLKGPEDTFEQFDISLTDLDATIMTQYQLVAAIAEVPGTKLLGTQPKGFNSTGDYEEASYHESLESIQTNDLTPLLKKHYRILIKSHVQPKFSTADFSISPSWNELDAMTGLERAQLNLAKVQTDAALEATGAIDAQDIRDRIINDPDSGYNGLDDQIPEIDPDIIAQAATIKGNVPKAKPLPGA